MRNSRKPNVSQEKKTVSIGEKIKYRLLGLPRSLREFDAVIMLLGTMRRIGWMQSAERCLPVDQWGKALPWWTYSAIYWVEELLQGSEDVFEYGSGNSTMWLAERVSHVTSIEDNRLWLDRLGRDAPVNIDCRYKCCGGNILTAPPGDPYVSAINEDEKKFFDLVVVDGKARESCVKESLPHLKKNGLLLLDNSDWPMFSGIHAYLSERDFHRIDFVGLIPGAMNFGCTSIFYKGEDRAPSPLKLPRFWGTKISDFKDSTTDV